ncbi:MAG TPA: S9 family peptidase [Pyrinomonadaceae bacterium]|nr:S9 family peptidase [Pyrinomonadaceae bacterium]
MKPLALTFLFCLALSVSAAQAQTRRGLTPADTLRVAAVGDAQISPGGEWVVYSVSETAGEATRTTLWLARSSPDLSLRPFENEVNRASPAGASQPLLPSGWSASNPRWSPDGRRIAFTSTRDGQSGIWVVTLSGDRQPRLVANFRQTNFFIPYAGEAFAWSPDSRRIAFINATEDESAPDEDSSRRDDPRVISRTRYKSRTSFADRLRTHVWVTEVDNPSPRQLTTGEYYDHSLSWSPNGRELAFLSNHEADADAVNNSDIFAVEMSGQVRQITSSRGCEYEPQWSPDGRWIAYTATRRDVTTIDSVAEDAHVWVIESQGGTGRELTGAQDRRARTPRWSPDSQSIFFLAGDRGRTLLFRVSLRGREVAPIFSERRVLFGEDTSMTDKTGPEKWPGLRSYQITGFSIAQRSGLLVGNPRTGESTSLGSAFALTISDSYHPAEVWVGSRPGYALLRLSGHNDALLNSVTLVEPEEITFKSFDGTPVQGWLMKPLGWRAGERYPLILSIHGGPHGMYGWGFNAAFQVYAARGYAVLYLNPRGSSGYGQRFSDGTLREWGGGDYRDLMLGVDEALRRYSWIDSERVGVTGGSYGGFMTNWIITQTPRFRAAVSVASVSNLISFYATSLYQDLIHAEFGGFPWDDYDLLWRWSPIRYVNRAQTPTLFLHGELDNDVHITQAEEMYMGLKRRGVETVLVRYPGEGHGFREPRHRVDAIERTLAWFDRFLK